MSIGVAGVWPNPLIGDVLFPALCQEDLLPLFPQADCEDFSFEQRVGLGIWDLHEGALLRFCLIVVVIIERDCCIVCEMMMLWIEVFHVFVCGIPILTLSSF